MSSPHKIIWNWDVSFGNVLSIAITVVAIGGAIIGGYIRYEKKFLQIDQRILEVEEDTFDNGELIEGHAAKVGIHITQAESALEFVPRLIYDLKESEQESRIRDAQADLKTDLAEIKGMVRDNGKAGLEQYRQLTNRIDQIVDP